MACDGEPKCRAASNINHGANPWSRVADTSSTPNLTNLRLVISHQSCWILPLFPGLPFNTSPPVQLNIVAINPLFYPLHEHQAPTYIDYSRPFSMKGYRILMSNSFGTYKPSPPSRN